MKPNRMKDVFESIVQRDVPANENLWPRIAAKVERKPPVRILRTVLIALLILLMLSGVVYALGRSLGYIPGLGIVDQNTPMLTLAEPVSQTRDGVTITVEKVVVNLDVAEVIFQVEGLPPDKFSFLEPLNSCMEVEELRFPNGVSLHGEGMSTPMETGFESDYRYSPVPAGIEEATLFIPCIQGAVTPGVLPENWELPLRLVPVPAGMQMTAIPVTEFPSPTPVAMTGTPEVNPISITKALEVEDSYILMGEFIPPAGADLSSSGCCTLDLFDGNGQRMDAEMPMDIDPGDPSVNTPFASTWVRKFPKEGLILPVTIDVANPHWTSISVPFEFDAGDDPQPGDEWQVNQSFDVGGRIFTLETIQVVRPQLPEAEGGYTFAFTYPWDDKIISLDDVSIEGYPPSMNSGFGGGGGGGGPTPARGGINFSVEFAPMPKGKLNVTFIFRMMDGEQHWTLPWQP
ncbi:MAG TPA: hypothetical protein VHP14_05790 [Anaerolineales bacterium]|nr:hypothetical protein [Anaerolineales bacterium]